MKWIILIILCFFILKSCVGKLQEPIGVADKFNQKSKNQEVNKEKNNSEKKIYNPQLFQYEDKFFVLLENGEYCYPGAVTSFGKIKSRHRNHFVADDNGFINYIIRTENFKIKEGIQNNEMQNRNTTNSDSQSNGVRRQERSQNPVSTNEHRIESGGTGASIK